VKLLLPAAVTSSAEASGVWCLLKNWTYGYFGQR